MSANDNLKLNRNHLDLRNGIAIKRVTITDASQMPKDYCTTPSGNTLFSTTPGGTRIIYDRAFLMSRKESPLAKSPPANLPYIPEITLIPPKDNSNLTKNLCNDSNKETTINREDTHDHNHNQTVKKDLVDNTQFEMDI